MCARDRPEDYVVPEDVPIDDITRQAQENDRLFQEVGMYVRGNNSVILGICKGGNEITYYYYLTEVLSHAPAVEYPL